MTLAKAKNELSVLTFNTFGVPLFAPKLIHRYKYIAQEINRGPYDVVCLQEIFSYFNLYLLKKRMRNFPYIAYDRNTFGPRGGLVIFSKHPVSDVDFITYSFPKNASVPFYAKFAQHGLLSCTIDNYNVRIATTHLSSDYEHKLTAKNKLYTLIKSQSDEAAIVINNYSKTYQTLLVTGDFNIAKHSELYNKFMEKTKVKDLFSHDEIATYYKDRFKYIYTAYDSNRIDYMFLKSTKKHVINKTEYVFTEPVNFASGGKSYLSDHNGLHCILRVDK